MSKLYREKIQVRAGPDDMPAEFQWRRKWYKVTACSMVKGKVYRLQWWRDPGPPKYRCETRQGVVCELSRDGEGWVLERVWD